MSKLAIISTHPIQYQVPLFRLLKKNGLNFKVFFASKHGANSKEIDPEFLKKIKWDIGKNILSGYKSKFSENQKYKIDDFRLNFRNIEKEFVEGKFKYVLILGWNNLHYLKAIYYAIKYNIKIILRVETNLESKINPLKKFFKFIILKELFQKNFIFSNYRKIK